VDDDFSYLFIDCLKDPDLSPELITLIEGLKTTLPSCRMLRVKCVGGRLKNPVCRCPS
jgi:hypothetical protein